MVPQGLTASSRPPGKAVICMVAAGAFSPAALQPAAYQPTYSQLTNATFRAPARPQYATVTVMGPEAEPYWEGRMRFRPLATPDPYAVHMVVAHSKHLAGRCHVFWKDLQQLLQQQQEQAEGEHTQVCCAGGQAVWWWLGAPRVPHYCRSPYLVETLCESQAASAD